MEDHLWSCTSTPCDYIAIDMADRPLSHGSTAGHEALNPIGATSHPGTTSTCKLGSAVGT
jgi:hypothetical protein